MNIDDLDLPPRVRTRLRHSGIRTVADLAECQASVVAVVLGRVGGLAAVEQALDAVGLHLGMDPAERPPKTA